MAKNGPIIAVSYSKLPRFVGPILLGVSIFLAGTAVFAINGNLAYFLTQPAMYVVILAIVWVSASFDWAFRKHVALYDDTISIFEPGTKGKELEKNLFRELYSDRKILRVATLPILGFESYVALTYLRILPVPSTFYQNLYSSPLILVYLAIVAAVAGYHWAAGGYLLIKHTLFVKVLSKEPVKINFTELKDLRERKKREKSLYDIQRFSFVSSLTWFGGVVFIALVVFPLAQVENWFTLAALGVSIGIGLLIFVLPQWFLHESIVRTKDNLIAGEVEHFRRKWGELGPDSPSVEVVMLASLVDHIAKLKEWPVDYGLITEEILVSVATILITYFARLQ